MSGFLFRPKASDRYWLILGLLAGLAFAALPFTTGGYITSIGFSVLLFGALASSWNLFSGYSGYISFGHAAFFGLGAYATSILVLKAGINPLVAVFLGGVITVLISLPMATATLRLDDVQFSIVMLAFAEILLYSTRNFEGLTGGVRGLVLPVGVSMLTTYFTVFILCGATIVVVYLQDRSHLGLALTAIHDDEDAAEAMGVNTTKYKVLSFSMSALFPGFAGGIAALYWTYINPITVFDPVLSGDLMIMSVLGGMGTVIGPLIGAFLLTPLRVEAQAQFPYLHGIVFGGVFLIFVLTMPDGIVNWIKDRQIMTRIRRTFGGDDS